MVKMSRTEHMMLSLWGARWKEAILVSFTIFLDDSGTSPSQHVAIASALIIPASRLIALEKEWDAFRVKEQFSCFHMSEFAALNPKSEFAGWANKQNRVAARIRQIVKKYAVKALSMSVNKEDYDAVVPHELRKYVNKFHYSWAISTILAVVERWALLSKVTSHFEYIFDNMGKPSDPKRREVEDILELCEEIAIKQGKAGQYAHWTFRNRCELPALQCADIIAWTCYQHAMLVFRKTPMKQLATDMWNDFYNHLNKEWLFPGTITRSNLEEWVKGEMADGRAIDRFEEFIARKYGRKT
jgi:hypothetical protein